MHATLAVRTSHGPPALRHNERSCNVELFLHEANEVLHHANIFLAVGERLFVGIGVDAGDGAERLCDLVPNIVVSFDAAVDNFVDVVESGRQQAEQFLQGDLQEVDVRGNGGEALVLSPVVRHGGLSHGVDGESLWGGRHNFDLDLLECVALGAELSERRGSRSERLHFQFAVFQGGVDDEIDRRSGGTLIFDFLCKHLLQDSGVEVDLALWVALGLFFADLGRVPTQQDFAPVYEVVHLVHLR